MSAAESAAIRRTDHSGLGRVQCGADIPDPELWVYRGRTTALLRRYFRLSIEVGRLPSMLGGEFFRAHLTYHRRYTFEDAVILVYDMERALEQLAYFGQQLIAWIVLQEYSQGEAARRSDGDQGSELPARGLSVGGGSALAARTVVSRSRMQTTPSASSTSTAT